MKLSAIQPTAAPPSKVGYGAALGGALKQTAGGIVKGFGYGLKGAMLSEMPGLVAGYGAFSDRKSVV
jgi:hypothetical protein